MESDSVSEFEAELMKNYKNSIGRKKGEYYPLKWEDVVNTDDKKKKNQKYLEQDLIFQQLIPSKTGFNNTTTTTTTLDARLSCANKFDKLTKVAVALKKDLEAQMKGIDSQFLLKSVDKVIHIVGRYRNKSKTRPFNWRYGTFPPSVKHISMLFVEDVDDIIWTSYQNSSKLSDCDPALPDFACIPPSWNEIWREFKEFTYETPEHQNINLKLVEELKRSIELDHPIVSVIGGFAVAAFNEACEMHVKKGEHDNLHDFEVMECKYLKITNTFQFYMTIEAIEEGNLGVYETQVLCSSDGTRTLSKFILTDGNPAGTKAMAISLFSCVRSFCETLKRTKAMAISLFSCVRSFCETLKHDIKEKESKLGPMFEATMVSDHGTAWALLGLLEKASDATMEGLHKVLSLGLRLLFSPNCNRTTNPDVWSHPGNHSISGMVPRRNGTPCRGYDYRNPIDLGSVW